jgi:hypothetical protein
MLINLWDAGRGLAEIADALAAAGYVVTTNAVAGRRHRLPRMAFTTGWLGQKLRPRRRIPRTADPVKPPVPKKKQTEPGVEYLDNTDGCRATLDRRGNWGLPMVCGEPVVKNNYCSVHFKRFHYLVARRVPDGETGQSPGNRNFRQGRA